MGALRCTFISLLADKWRVDVALDPGFYTRPAPVTLIAHDHQLHFLRRLLKKLEDSIELTRITKSSLAPQGAFRGNKSQEGSHRRP